MKNQMQDNNFENFLRQKAGELKVVPSERVWKGIESDLKKSHRRKFFWWPVLFLCSVAGGSVIYFYSSQSLKHERSIIKPVTQQLHAKEKSNEVLLQNELSKDISPLQNQHQNNIDARLESDLPLSVQKTYVANSNKNILSLSEDSNFTNVPVNNISEINSEEPLTMMNKYFHLLPTRNEYALSELPPINKLEKTVKNVRWMGGLFVEYDFSNRITLQSPLPKDKTKTDGIHDWNYGLTIQVPVYHSLHAIASVASNHCAEWIFHDVLQVNTTSVTPFDPNSLVPGDSIQQKNSYNYVTLAAGLLQNIKLSRHLGVHLSAAVDCNFLKQADFYFYDELTGRYQFLNEHSSSLSKKYYGYELSTGLSYQLGQNIQFRVSIPYKKGITNIYQSDKQKSVRQSSGIQAGLNLILN